jgi:beta-barrel assembly-enhancing protease
MKTFPRFVFFCVVACLAAQARVQPSSGFDLFSQDEEIAAGKQAGAEIPKQLPVLSESDPVSFYVNRLGQELASHAPGQKWPYTFRVVNQKEINAFALPGGPVFVNLGTIQAADNEAQLAGVMAHEISHVVQRHGTRAASKQMAAQVPLAILGGFMGRGTLSQMAQMGISFGVGSYFLKNSRSAESEADLLGTDIMYDTGFDPHQMAVFFAKLAEEGGSRSPQFLSDHPDPGNRSQAVSKEVSTLTKKTSYRGNGSEFLQIKQRVAGMKPLTSQQIADQQKQVAATGAGTDIKPATASKVFNHSQYQISYPENWQVFGDQNSSVTIAPQSGVSENAVAYGVIVNNYQPEDSANNLDNATHDLLTSLRQGNPDLREIGHDENIRVSGVAGKSVDLIGTSPLKDSNGRAIQERDWLVTFQGRDKSLLYLVFISPDKDFASMRPTFEQILKSVRLK